METVTFENETARMAVDRNVAVVCWRAAPTAPLELREMERVGKRLCLQYPRGTALFNVIVSGKPSFSQEVHGPPRESHGYAEQSLRHVRARRAVGEAAPRRGFGRVAGD